MGLKLLFKSPRVSTGVKVIYTTLLRVLSDSTTGAPKPNNVLVLDPTDPFGTYPPPPLRVSRKVTGLVCLSPLL